MYTHTHTHTHIHTQKRFIYLWEFFKLISLSPGENGNCLPRVKGDDKGKERRWRPSGRGRNCRRVRKRQREKVVEWEELGWQFERVDKACFDKHRL